MASEHTGQAEMRVPGLMKKDMNFREVKVCHFQTTHGICELMTMLIFLCPLKFLTPSVLPRTSSILLFSLLFPAQD